MGLADAYQDGTEEAIQTMATLPMEPAKPESKHSGLSTLPRAIGAAGSEIAANVLDIAGAYGKTVSAYGAPSASPFGQTDEEKAESAQMRKRLAAGDDLFRNPQSEAVYGFARNLRPDPETASMAENITFSLTKGLTKAIGSTLFAGPLAGVTSFGTSEGMTAAEDLAVQGVDKQTRTEVGAVTGLLTGGSALLPVAGPTVAKTIGLAVTGGPAAFMMQQKATKEILSHANYDELAKQYNPLDPAGLAVATLLPAGFGAWAMRGSKAFKTIKSTSDVDSPQQSVERPATSQESVTAPSNEQLDAVMTHNLTLARDVQETIDPRDVALKSLQQLHDSQTKEIADLLSLAGNRAEPGAIPMIKQEMSRIDYDLAQLDQYFGIEAKRLQGEGLSRKQAESNAMKLLDDKRQDLLARRNLLDDQLNTNADATQAAQRIADLERSRADTLANIEQIKTGKADFIAQETLKAGEFNAAELTPVERSGLPAPTPIQVIAEKVKELFNSDLTAPSERIKHSDPRIEAALNRVEELNSTAPDMHIALNQQGERVELKTELEAIRREVQEGSDEHLGIKDADLLKVASECFLTVGSV
jgi:hypothetical protein